MNDQLRILLAEDVPADAELVQRELRKAGLEFQVRLVETRAAFLAALREFAPDIVLTDYQMPRFNGREALQLAQAHAPAVPAFGRPPRSRAPLWPSTRGGA